MYIRTLDTKRDYSATTSKHLCLLSCAYIIGVPLLTTFLVDEGREGPNTTISGPLSARQRWWPYIEYWLGSFVVLQEIRTSIAKISEVYEQQRRRPFAFLESVISKLSKGSFQLSS